MHLSADEGDEFQATESPFTIQFSYKGDWFTGNKKIKGVDEFLIYDRPDLGADEVHGSTRNGNVFGILQNVLDGKSKSSSLESNFAKDLIQSFKDALTVPSSITKPSF